MSSFGHQESDLLRRAREKTYVDETLKKQKRKQRLARLKKGLAGVRIPDKKPKPKGHHQKRMESLEKQLRTGRYEKPEFSASIPDERSTIAAMVGGSSRQRFQSPEPRPPVTPPRRRVPALVRAETPISLTDYAGRPVQAPKGHYDRKKRGPYKKKKRDPAPPRAKPRPEAIWLDDTETDDDSMAATAGESESDPEAKAEESETDDSDTSSEYGMDPLAFGPGRAQEAYQHMRRQHYLHRVRRDPQAFLAARARQKKARQDQKRQRLAKRHGHNQKIRTHTPFVPKLQISQQGPGEYKVRSTGLSPAIRKQVKTLLSRIKGKLFINGKFTSLKRAFSVIMALLTKKQVIQVQVK